MNYMYNGMKNLRSKKIGLVLPNVPAYSETFFTSMIKGLQKNGFEVILFVGGKPSNSFVLTKVVSAPDFSVRLKLIVEMLIIIRTLLSNLKKAICLFSLSRKDGATALDSIRIVLINNHFLPYKLEWLHFGFGTMALQRENVAQAINAKMAVSFRGFDLYIYPTKHINCYQKLFSKKVRYHVLSNEMKVTLIENGISDQFIFKITPAIDFESFKRTTPFSFDSPIRFLTVGRLHWKKGLEYTLEALFYFKQNNNIPFEYRIIGEGIEKERLKFAVYQLGLTENVIFVGKVSQQEVIKHMEQSHVYLQYSLQEGFCNAVLEAQAMGLFCIVSDADGLNENVLDEETGWVVPKRSPKLLAQIIEKVIGLNEIEKNEIRRNAIGRVKEEFNLTKQNQEFRSFYTDLS
ncbi:glycosyltransferase family 4 protein [Flavobacterium sp.]|uniref:glycosyltransferase family 4 protein n=1 Tax=Flavobacterium sp. TaxID=239 RepID=UPI0037BF33F4